MMGEKSTSLREHAMPEAAPPEAFQVGFDFPKLGGKGRLNSKLGKALLDGLALSSASTCDAVCIWFDEQEKFWWHEGWQQCFDYAPHGQFIVLEKDWWRNRVHPDDFALTEENVRRYFEHPDKVLIEPRVRFQQRNLTFQEGRILSLLGAGKTNKEISRLTRTAPNTVKTHLRNIFRKLDVSNRAQAATVAHRRGMVN
jgi:DNA-binding CsgD family transcriptional regulator